MSYSISKRFTFEVFRFLLQILVIGYPTGDALFYSALKAMEKNLLKSSRGTELAEDVNTKNLD